MTLYCNVWIVYAAYVLIRSVYRKPDCLCGAPWLQDVYFDSWWRDGSSRDQNCLISMDTHIHIENYSKKTQKCLLKMQNVIYFDKLF